MADDRKILIIGDINEFLLRAVSTEMTRRKYNIVNTAPTIDAINFFNKGIRVYLLFIDSAEAIKDVLVYLKDLTSSKRIQIGLVGERLNVQEAIKYLGKENVSTTFERPVDSKMISDGLEELYALAQKNGRRRRILLVDDDPEFLRRTERVLHNHYKIYMAATGASAIKLLTKHNVDLILLDYQMPVLDGPKTMEVLRTEPETANIPVIFLSGITDARSITKAMLLGPETYLSKELAAKELCAVIADFFAKKDYEEGRYFGDDEATDNDEQDEEDPFASLASGEPIDYSSLFAPKNSALNW